MTTTPKADTYIATFRFFRIIQKLQLMSKPEVKLDVWRLMRNLSRSVT